METNTQSWNDLASLEPQSGSNNLLLIDGNNLAYRWVGRANYNNYSTDYVRTAQSLGKSYDAPRIVCLFDFGKSYYRKGLDEGYKASRKPPKEPEDQKRYEEFFECLNKTIEELPLEYYKHRGVEADDLIAFFVQKEKANYDHIWIVSSDRDLYQLIDDNVSIFNLYSRKEITIDTLLEDRGLTPLEAQLAKIIEGDKGDDIPGIDGIGEKRSAALAIKYSTLQELILALPIKGKAKYIQNLNAGKERLLMNDKLINLLKYSETAIKAGKDGDEYWRFLNEG